MQKKLMVLGAGILQVPVIKKGREMGLYVIAVDDDSKAPGLALADKAIIPGGLIDEDKMAAIAKAENIDGVIHPCSEVAMHVVGRINDELHLHGITREMTVRATNKHLMREAFERYGAPSVKSFLAKDDEDAWHIFCEEFKTRAILKPSRNSGSRGISKVERGISKEDFCALYQSALDISYDHSVVIEQFIDGPEFSVETIVYDGEPHVLAITDKITTCSPHFVELGHSQPSLFPQHVQQKLIDGAIAGIKALGLSNCATHCELKLQGDEVYLMEIGARMGGDFISTDLTRLSTGIDMVEATIQVILGEKPSLQPMDTKCGACIRYFTPKPGKLIEIQHTDLLEDANIYDADIYHEPGDVIPEVRSSLDRSGHVIVTDESVEEAIKKADAIISGVKFIIE